MRHTKWASVVFDNILVKHFLLISAFKKLGSPIFIINYQTVKNKTCHISVFQFSNFYLLSFGESFFLYLYLDNKAINKPKNVARKINLHNLNPLPSE